MNNLLTRLCLMSPKRDKIPQKGTLGKSVDQDQMPHSVASDQGLYCL